MTSEQARGAGRLHLPGLGDISGELMLLQWLEQELGFRVVPHVSDTRGPSVPRTIAGYVCCPIIILRDVLFQSHMCPSLDLSICSLSISSLLLPSLSLSHTH